METLVNLGVQRIFLVCLCESLFLFLWKQERAEEEMMLLLLLVFKVLEASYLNYPEII